MPRSKRKAKAPTDFVRKKVKLGKKARPANYTDTSITKRQIHVPNQSRTTTSTTGLPLPDLLSRTRHHNTNTRTASLNALTNALTDPSATAHTAVNTPSPVIAAACQALSDESPPVRVAALQLLQRLIAIVDITPFKSTITNLLIAALTHIRLDIRIHVANALPSLTVSDQTILSQNPLEPLSDLLTSSQSRAKSAALAAIAALCKRKPHHQKPYTGRFFYHRESKVPQNDNFIATLPESARSLLITRVAEAVLEHLHQPPRTISTSCAALAGVISYGLPKPSRKSVESVLTTWRYTRETHSLARVALTAGSIELAVGYVIKMLERDKYNDAFDTVIQECAHVPEVSLAFGKRFQRAVGERDAGFVKNCCRTAVVIMESCEADLLIRMVPQAVKMLSEGDEDTACDLVKAACGAWKGRIRDADLAKELVGVCTSPLVTAVVDEVAGVAVCAGVLTGEVCVGVLGDCVRQERMEVVDTFMDALEWLAGRPAEEQLRAIALVRALGRVVRDGLQESVNRIEAVVV